MSTPYHACHDLDRLVHGEVFGNDLFMQDEMRAEAESVWKTQPHCHRFLRGFWSSGDHETAVFTQSMPSYSDEMKAAWLVVERMERKGYDSILTRTHEGYTALFYSQHDEGKVSVDPLDGGMPLAICRAALLALGNAKSSRPSATEGPTL